LTGADPDGDPLRFQVTSPPAHGQLSGNLPNLIYTPASGVSGSDSYTYIASDGDRKSVAATVSIQVSHMNHPPSDSNLTVQTTEGPPVAFTLAGTDPDGDPLQFQVTSPPAHGQLSGTPPNLIYTPASGVSGSDSFTYIASD